MAHAVQGFLINLPRHRSIAMVASSLKVYALTPTIDMVPFTDELHDELAHLFPRDTDRPYPQFWKLSQSAEHFARLLSHVGPVAYLETEHFFGGVGEQSAAVWSLGEIVIQPTAGEGSINSALRFLDVTRAADRDEFDVVGLGRLRMTDEWQEQASSLAG